MPEGASTRTRLSPTTYHEWLWPSIAGRNTFAGVRTRLLLRRPTAADAASPAAAPVAARNSGVCRHPPSPMADGAVFRSYALSSARMCSEL